MLTELHDTHDAKSRASMNDHGSFVTLTFRTEHDTITLYLPPNMLACVSMIVPAYNAHMVDDGEKSAMEMAKATHAVKATDEQMAEAVHSLGNRITQDPQTISNIGVNARSYLANREWEYLDPRFDPHGLAPSARLDAALKLEDGE